MPTVWGAVTEYLLTETGKIQKFALRDKFLAGQILAL
jgi:hypothetical protein